MLPLTLYDGLRSSTDRASFLAACVIDGVIVAASLSLPVKSSPGPEAAA